MGTLDDIQKAYGDGWDELAETATRENWKRLCVCGHLQRYHGPGNGGTFQFPPFDAPRVNGEVFKPVFEFDGCKGALANRGFELTSQTADHANRILTVHFHPTCPCREFRHVVDVDRPNRYFNHRLTDRHPMLTGIRALRTHLSKRKAARTDLDWTTAEFERRFVWVDGARKCSISGCTTEGSDVLPAYVNDDRHSEMRCAAHR